MIIASTAIVTERENLLIEDTRLVNFDELLAQLARAVRRCASPLIVDRERRCDELLSISTTPAGGCA
jgi:hypothetical protein